MESLVGISGSCVACRVPSEVCYLPIRNGIRALRDRSSNQKFQLIDLKLGSGSKFLRQQRIEGPNGRRVFAAIQTANALKEPLAELKAGQFQEFHDLPSGLKLEVIVQTAGRDSKKKPSPLLFVHGSSHAAWCWTYHWMPFFSARGYDCYAISLLGQGASDVPQAAVAGSLDSHARDIAHLIRSKFSTPPVLIAHSFGGLVAQCFLSNTGRSSTSEESEGVCPRPAGVVLACSAPPSGNGPMVTRYLKRDFIASVKITLGFAAKMIGTSLSICRDCLFSPDIPESELKEYQGLLKRSSRLPILDVRALNKSLPVPRPPEDLPPVLVLHAENDYVVDAEGSQETAEWCGTQPVVVLNCAHDIMLDNEWQQAAHVVNSWLDEHSL
ncbi:hypothetical protein Mapa_002680 [Marchantia paleacea]|nr:hypothetical protein Mapa_002680 [Marchantia paleacea]